MKFWLTNLKSRAACMNHIVCVVYRHSNIWRSQGSNVDSGTSWPMPSSVEHWDLNLLLVYTYIWTSNIRLNVESPPGLELERPLLHTSRYVGVRVIASQLDVNIGMNIHVRQPWKLVRHCSFWNFRSNIINIEHKPPGLAYIFQGSQTIYLAQNALPLISFYTS